MTKSDLHDMQLYLHMETDKALLCSETGDRDRAKWLPRSQIEWRKTDKQQIIEVTMPEWLAYEKGFI